MSNKELNQLRIEHALSFISFLVRNCRYICELLRVKKLVQLNVRV